jgi:hypothetical protein
MTMFAKSKISPAITALICISGASIPDAASAVTVEVAKRCQELTAKAFPPKIVGNPAAGSAKGSGRDASAYYKKCVEDNGKVEEQNKAK